MIATALESPTPVNTATLPVGHISPSSLKDYLQCPRRWAFRKIDKLPEPISPALHLGKAVHHGIEQANRALFRDQEVDDGTILNDYRDHFHVLEELEGPLTWIETGQRDKLLLQGEAMLKAFLESSVFKDSGKPLGVEIRLSCDIPGTNIELLGFIDRVNADGAPIDYKSIAATPNIENELWQHDIQLNAYSLLVESSTGQPCPAPEVVFITKHVQPKVIRAKGTVINDVKRQRFWSLTHAVIDGIRSERFHPQPGMHCSWCSFRNECSGWSGKGGPS